MRCQGTVFIGVLIPSLRPVLHYGLKICVQSLQLLRACAYPAFLTKGARMNPHVLIVIEGPQTASSDPETVIWSRSLLVDFGRIQLRNLHVFLTPETYVWVLLRRFPGGEGHAFIL